MFGRLKTHYLAHRRHRLLLPNWEMLTRVDPSIAGDLRIQDGNPPDKRDCDALYSMHRWSIFDLTTHTVLMAVPWVMVLAGGIWQWS
jgi:hypothetical protein